MDLVAIRESLEPAGFPSLVLVQPGVAPWVKGKPCGFQSFLASL